MSVSYVHMYDCCTVCTVHMYSTYSLPYARSMMYDTFVYTSRSIVVYVCSHISLFYVLLDYTYSTVDQLVDLD